MKQLTTIIAALIFFAFTSTAQTEKAFDTNRAYAGAPGNKTSYRAIFQLDNNDPKIIEKAIRNINNALKDPRLAGKIEIELIASAGGTEAYLKGGKYEEDLKALIQKGVIVAQCNNSLVERKINRDQIYDFVGVVPSAVGELITRETDGWTIIKP